jgi:hypothetical protein
MLFVVQADRSTGKQVLEPLVVSAMIEGWTSVLETQRFQLTAPGVHCEAIGEACSSMASIGLRGAALLLLAAAPAVRYELSEAWEAVLRQIAGTP